MYFSQISVNCPFVPYLSYYVSFCFLKTAVYRKNVIKVLPLDEYYRKVVYF
jgi:hypothetical protein